jgi:hypothetical protein
MKNVNANDGTRLAKAKSNEAARRTPQMHRTMEFRGYPVQQKGEKKTARAALIAICLIVVFLRPPSLTGRGDDAVIVTEPPTGFTLNNVTTSFGYSSLDTNQATGTSPGVTGEGSYASVSLSAGYSHINGATAFSISYLPSYLTMNDSTHSHSFDQNLGLDITKHLSRQWTLSVSAQAEDRSLPQVIFNTPLALVDDLNDPGRPILTGMTSSSVPYALTLYGERMLMFSNSVRMLYHRSPRLSFTGGAGYSQSQSLNGSSGAMATLLSQSRNEDGFFNVSYSLDPKTYLNVGVNYGRAASNISSYQATTVERSLARKLGRRWFAGGSLGMGYYRLPGAATSWTAGSLLEFRGREYSVSFKADREVGNSYGLAARSSVDYNALVSWRLRNTDWTAFASGGEQQLTGSELGTLKFWLVNAGLTRQIAKRASLSVSYVYSGSMGLKPTYYANLGSHAARVTLTWNPPPTRKSSGATRQ